MAALFQAREREETAIPITEVWKDGEIDIFPEVQNQKYFEIRFRGRRLIITAGKFVGFIPLNERIVIYVEPKVPATNLVHLLAVAGGVVALGRERQYRFVPSTAPPLLEAMAGAFISYLEAMEIDGLYKTYLNRNEAQSVLKGQMRFHESMQLWCRGKRHLAVSSYFDLSSDVPENQLLYFACRNLVSHFLALGASPLTLRSLSLFEELFSRAGVTLRLPEEGEITEAGLRVAHVRALRLANALIARQGVELPLGGTDVFLPSFVIDMESLFEEYIVRVLRQNLPQLQVVSGGEATKSLFDDRSVPTASPDAAFLSHDAAVAVGDVKYKPRYTREDLNQVISYALSYRVRVAVLFLPALTAAEAGLSKVGEVRGIHVYQHRMWLGAGDLFAEAREMATSLNAVFQAEGQIAQA